MSEVRIPTSGWLSWPETQKLVAAFDGQGDALRFVGGAVRDALLKRPVSDVDAATTLPPQKVMSLLEKAGIKVVPTGLSHGTVTAVVEGKPFEVTTLRRDVQTHGRHADVVFTTDWQQDAARRDFTLNALYCDAQGKVYDYFQGVRDAKAGRVVFIGDALQRIEEDGLRILRFFRFHAHYGQEAINHEGLNACFQKRSMIEKLSGERIQQEMLKLLAADAAAEMIDAMIQSEVMEMVLPGARDTSSMHAWPRVRLMTDHQPDAAIALALLLRSTQDTAATLSALVKRWKISNKLQQRLTSATRFSAIATTMPEAEQKAMLRRLGNDGFLDRVLISWAEHLSETPDKAQMIAAAYRMMLNLAQRWDVPQFPLNGEDLQAVGVAPGPELGQWLQFLEQWWEREDYKPGKAELLKYFQAQK